MPQSYAQLTLNEIVHSFLVQDGVQPCYVVRLEEIWVNIGVV